MGLFFWCICFRANIFGGAGHFHIFWPPKNGGTRRRHNKREMWNLGGPNHRGRAATSWCLGLGEFYQHVFLDWGRVSGNFLLQAGFLVFLVFRTHGAGIPWMGFVILIIYFLMGLIFD